MNINSLLIINSLLTQVVIMSKTDIVAITGISVAVVVIGIFGWFVGHRCPKCSSRLYTTAMPGIGETLKTCLDCHHKWY